MTPDPQHAAEKAAKMFFFPGITWPLWWPSLSQISTFSDQIVPILAAIAGFFSVLVMIRKWWTGSWMHGYLAGRRDSKKGK